MTEDHTAKRPDDKDDPITEAESQPEELLAQDEPVPFLYKVIAFAVLALPFSFLLSWMQGLFEDQLSSTLNHFIVLAGIVAFLLLVGALAKRIHSFHKSRLGR